MITPREDLEDDSRWLTQATFWKRAAAIGFSAWAAVVPIAATAVIMVLSTLSDRFEAYVLAMERRVTLLEERQSRVIQNIEQMMRQVRENEQRIDRIENSERRMDRIDNGERRKK